ncbi:MAG TPA: lysylphosphatidylglycerol synthase transmembrane domain-containing protein [Nitrososphaeraceae archaeon]|nr:lysylphosphatidylglycerol synthase transmembrane domain-containing protein [Nitrososphaeraceae archaeon]
MNWRLIAILISLLPLLFLFIFSPVSITDIFSVGLFPFIISVIFSLTKVFLQAFRFKYFVDQFLGYKVASSFKLISVRIGSEFVTNTTPSYIGGEIVRIAWLTKNKVPAGIAAWIATMEIIADVFVGTILALIAGIFALYNGAILIGTIIIIVSSLIFGFWLLVIIFSAHYNIQLPQFVTKLIKRFLSKERADKIIIYTNSAISDLCTMSRENFNSKRTIKIFFVGIVITFFAFACLGASFLVLGGIVESNLDFYKSILATAASTELGSLPITVGGSGLTELGLWAYVSGLDHLPSINDVLQDSHLDVIISWRIASYHIPLIMMWVLLMKLAIEKKNTSVKNKLDQ